MKLLFGTLTCPECGLKQKMEMPSKGCLYFYKCDGCGKLISGKNKCVFCSYGDKKCQIGC